MRGAGLGVGGLIIEFMSVGKTQTFWPGRQEMDEGAGAPPHPPPPTTGLGRGLYDWWQEINQVTLGNCSCVVPLPLQLRAVETGQTNMLILDHISVFTWEPICPYKYFELFARCINHYKSHYASSLYLLTAVFLFHYLITTKQKLRMYAHILTLIFPICLSTLNAVSAVLGLVRELWHQLNQKQM